MFKKLRNKLILINLGITSFIIVTIFTTIYLISTKAADNRPPNIQGVSFDEIHSSEYTDNDNNGVPDDLEEVVLFSVKKEKKDAASSLLTTLLICGVAIEAIVVIVSYFLAEEAIKPVKDAYESQKQFIANASHEIKTPLAAITANLEAADIHDNKWIKNVEHETVKLTALNNSLLDLARTGIVTNIKTEEVDLKILVLRALDSFESRVRGKKLTHQIKFNKKVKINAADFDQIMSILMDNAIKYSNKNITVKLTDHALSITNDGKTISPEKLPYVFDRFYQTDKTTDGVGLGLAIAKSLAERNHWRICVKASNKNTTFTLNF